MLTRKKWREMGQERFVAGSLVAIEGCRKTGLEGTCGLGGGRGARGATLESRGKSKNIRI